MDEPNAEPSENMKPGPFGADLIVALEDAGIIPRYTQRVVIEASLDEFTRIYAELAAKDGANLQRILVSSPDVARATVSVVNQEAT